MIGGIVFLALGTVFQAIGFVVRNSVGGWQTARGTITELRPTVGREFGSVDYPTVRYTLPSGQVIETEASSSAAVDDGEVVGAEVTVRYDPDDPQQIELGSGSTSVGTVFIGFGVLLDAVGIVLLVLSAL